MRMDGNLCDMTLWGFMYTWSKVPRGFGDSKGADNEQVPANKFQ